MADADRFLIDPALLALEWSGNLPPLGFVQLDALDRVEAIRLPPFPLVGLGDLGHPAAAAVDAVIEPPVSAVRLAEHVASHPHAAMALVQLMRGTESLSPEQALPLESMCYAMLQGSDDHIVWRDRRVVGQTLPPGQVLLERDEDTLCITIDRPAARNAIDRVIRDALAEAFSLAIDPGIRRIDLRATGRAFGIGADLAEFGTTRDPAVAHVLRVQTLPAYPLLRCAERVEVHVQGACIGAALELAAFAGRVTAAPSAWFQLPELAMGIIPGAGGCVSVPRRIGRRRAALMILSGRRIDATTALHWGLIDAIVDEDTVDPGCADSDVG